jgi:hypothetical protein
MKNGREEREECEGMTKSKRKKEVEEWEITHRSMAFQHSLTRSGLQIPHTNSIVTRS